MKFSTASVLQELVFIYNIPSHVTFAEVVVQISVS